MKKAVEKKEYIIDEKKNLSRAPQRTSLFTNLSRVSFQKRGEEENGKWNRFLPWRRKRARAGKSRKGSPAAHPPGSGKFLQSVATVAFAGGAGIANDRSLFTTLRRDYLQNVQ